MGIVWQILPFHLSLNENKTRQLLITNNREMSQGESYPIKTSPVNPAGWLAELGKWAMFWAWLGRACLNGMEFNVSDETCNFSWILNLISKIEDKCVSIIWNRLLNYTCVFKFGLHLSVGLRVLRYHHGFIDIHLEAIWKKKKISATNEARSNCPIFANEARHRLTGLDSQYCLLIGSFPLA